MFHHNIIIMNWESRLDTLTGSDVYFYEAVFIKGCKKNLQLLLGNSKLQLHLSLSVYSCGTNI